MSHPRNITLALLVTLCACGEPSPAEPEPTESELPPSESGLVLAAQEFGVDPYEIGREWYSYDGTHVLTPEPWIYVVTRGDTVHAFDIDSYYDDRGDSGVFTLTIAKLAGDEWQKQSVQSTKNAKQEPVCVTLDPAAEVDCDEPYDMVFRTAWRALPGGGFAVQEPAIYFRSHFALPETAIEVRIAEYESFDDLPTSLEELNSLPARPSASRDARHSRVGWLHDAADDAPRADTQLQITSNLHVAQWRVEDLQADADEVTVTFSARCQLTRLDDQEPFSEDATSFTVALPLDAPYTGRFLQICDVENVGAVVGEAQESFTKPPLGLWPDAKTFDLIVEQVDGRVAIRLAPGHLLWNWTRGTGADPTDPFDPIDLDQVWSDQLQ